jgi:TetR/AcrR family transcriptional repressor of nem operon
MPRPKSFDEDAVLDQAAELFWERGYEATSLADLEAHLGLGRQSLYNAFGDKQTLFLKALARYQRVKGEAAMARLESDGAGLAALRSFFHLNVDTITAPGPRHGCLVTNTISERGALDPDTLQACNHSREALERAFRRALARAQTAGELTRPLDLEATATMLVLQHYGLNVMAKTGAPAAELHAAVEALFGGLE